MLASSSAAGDASIRLTDDGRLKASPVFCDGGREIVYVELATPSLYRLMRLKLADRSIAPVHADANTSELDPAFSADGKVFCHLKAVGVLRVSLEIFDAGGAKLGEVPPGNGFSGMRSPAVSPDREHVVYSFAEGGRQQLYEVKVDGKEKRMLTDSLGINNWPAYSPDGRGIVFASSRDGDFEIYRMSARGGDGTRLTSSPGQDIRPKFSPDGKRIAFTSHRDGNAELYLMNSDGSAPVRITDSPERDDYCDWHPDGRHLAAICERDGRHDVYLIPVAE